MLKKLCIALLLQVCFAFTCIGMTKSNNIDVPDSVPFFDETGAKVFLDEFEGQTILLTFWATWCSSCLHEILNLDLLQKDFKKLPFVILAISEDFHGMQTVKNYFKTAEIRHLKAYHDYKNQLFFAFTVAGLPTSFLIDINGKVVASFSGTTNWHDDNVRKQILSYIPGNPVEPKNSYNTQVLNQKVKSKSPLKSNKEHKNEPSNKL